MRTFTTLFINLLFASSAMAGEINHGMVIYEPRDQAFKTWVDEFPLEYLTCEEIDGGYYLLTVELIGEDAFIIDEMTREDDRIYHQKRWWTKEEIEDNILEHGCPSDAIS